MKEILCKWFGCKLIEKGTKYKYNHSSMVVKEFRNCQRCGKKHVRVVPYY